MRLSQVIVVCLALTFGVVARATSFIVPDDTELVEKSRAIIIGNVERAHVQGRGTEIVTIYEIRVERALKGLPRASDLLQVASPGGVIGNRGLLVPSSPHFSAGEHVLLFLDHESDGQWRTTDLTLGKFRFATSTRGDRLLVRDAEDIAGWDRDGEEHQEMLRREEGFLRFIEERVRGRQPQGDYLVHSSEVTLPPKITEASLDVIVNAPFPGATYTDWVSSRPIRWPDISAGVTFHKRVDQNISGAADGGVSVIQSGLAAWTNECGSVIDLAYGGTTSTASANFDSVHVVEFNDPQGRISGSWSGSGTIAVAFMSFGGEHSYAGQTWWSITDADVVFQDGYPATHRAFGTAMTHELGHGVGWRHSNQDYATGGACVASTQECTSAAIMNSSVNSAYGFTLQPWDVNAAQSVYPGGSCGCTAPAIPSHPSSTTISKGASVTLSVIATGATPLTYQWYIGSSGNTGSPIGGATGSSLTVTPTATTSYWVRVSNSCGTANSNTATVTVTQPAPLPAPVIQATATSTTSVTITWNAVSGAAGYNVYRSASNSPYSLIGQTAGTTFVDSSVSPNTSYLYKVLARDASGNQGALSALDPATTVIFTDDPLVAGSTRIKAVHITQLRTAINALRAAAGLSAASFTDPSLSGVRVKAIHIAQLRTALNQARSALGLATITFTDSTITAGTTKIKAIHVTQLRSGVK